MKSGLDMEFDESAVLLYYHLYTFRYNAMLLAYHDTNPSYRLSSFPLQPNAQ